MKDTPPQEAQTLPDFKVTLKPILGIKPAHYLAFFYSFAILAVLYFLLLHEGLVHPGTKVSLQSAPPGASVFYNDRWLGSTPLEVFLPEGEGVLRFSRPGFLIKNEKVRWGSSLFFSLFLPRAETFRVELLPDTQNPIEDMARMNLDRWALAGPFWNEYQPPPIFTDFVRDAQAAGRSLDEIKVFLRGRMAQVTDPWLYRDLSRAVGLDPAADFEAQYRFWETFWGSTAAGEGRLAFWLLVNQPRDRRSELSKTAFFQKTLENWKSSIPLAAPPPETLGPLTFAGETFRFVPPGAFYLGASGTVLGLPLHPPYLLPVPTVLPGYWMAEHEVTRGQYATFVKEVPAWAPSRREELAEMGLVDHDYLKNWSSDQPEPQEAGLPVNFVSFFAARAYAQWFDARLSSRQVRASLPSEAHWEWAAREARANGPADDRKTAGGKVLLPVTQQVQNTLGLKGLRHSLWEMMRHSYAGGEFLVRQRGEAWSADSIGPETQISVRGGSFANPQPVAVYERAGQSALWCTEFLGFRLMLERK